MLVGCREVLIIFTFSVLVSGRSDRVLLRDVEAITLQSKTLAASRKGYRIPQLQCKGGSAYSNYEYHPKTAQCYNRGFDGLDVQWECKAELNEMVKFGHIEVNCEGYDHPDDKHILQGSCALRYDLDFRGQKRPSEHRSFFHEKIAHHRNVDFLLIIGLVVAALVIWYFCIYPNFSRHGYIPPDEYTTNPNNDYPPYAPPDYYEATRNRYPHQSDDCCAEPSAPPSDDIGWNSNLFGGSGSSRRRYHKTSCDNGSSSSWLSNGLAAGAGFLGGYFMGSSRSPQPCAQTRTYVSRDSPCYSDYTTSTRNEYYSSTRSRSRSSSPSSRVSTAFASTSRR